MKIYEIIGLYFLHLLVMVLTVLGLSNYFSKYLSFLFGNFFGLIFFVIFFEKGRVGFRSISEIFLKKIIYFKNNFLEIFLWIVFSIIFGFVIRLGVDGFYMIFSRIFFIDLFNQEILDLKSIDSDAGYSLGLMYFFYVFSGAIREEFIYRYYIQSFFFVKYNLVAAILITSFVFSVAHLNPLPFFAGLSFSLIYIASGSIFTSIVAHACSNILLPVVDVYFMSYYINNIFFVSLVFASLYFLLVVILVFYVLKFRKKIFVDGFNA